MNPQLNDDEPVITTRGVAVIQGERVLIELVSQGKVVLSQRAISTVSTHKPFNYTIPTNDAN